MCIRDSVFMTQLLPSSAYPIRRELKTLVYQAIADLCTIVVHSILVRPEPVHALDAIARTPGGWGMLAGRRCGHDRRVSGGT